MHRYGGYISGIKNGEATTMPMWVNANSPQEAVQKLRDVAKIQFPQTQGWSNHANTTEERLVKE